LSSNIHKLFNPDSIAVVGASNKPGKMGNLFIKRLAEGKIDARVEQSLGTSLTADCPTVLLGPTCYTPGDRFTQLVVDGRIVFPTFGSQTFSFLGHTVLTGGEGIAPVQRFGYLGGANTLPTVNLLAIGGDQLLFLSGEYKIPFDKIALPYLGNPFVTLRYAAGNAGVDC